MESGTSPVKPSRGLANPVGQKKKKEKENKKHLKRKRGRGRKGYQAQEGDRTGLDKAGRANCRFTDPSTAGETAHHFHFVLFVFFVLLYMYSVVCFPEAFLGPGQVCEVCRSSPRLVLAWLLTRVSCLFSPLFFSLSLFSFYFHSTVCFAFHLACLIRDTWAKNHGSLGAADRATGIGAWRERGRRQESARARIPYGKAAFLAAPLLRDVPNLVLSRLSGSSFTEASPSCTCPEVGYRFRMELGMW